MKPMRYAHSDGHTDVCYDDTGRYILTCGSDGDVRIWDGIEDDDAVSHRLGERAYAIAFKKDRFFTATDSNSVQASKFPDGMPDGLVTRFTAPVNHMVLNAEGTIMVAGSSDFTVKVVEVESSSHKVYRGHKAPVMTVALHPSQQLVASSSCDGTVQVWSVDDQTEVKTLPLLDKCSDLSLAKSLCRLCWSPDGQMLCVPVGKEVHLYSKDTWEVVDKLTSPDLTGVVNVVSMSPDGQFVAAACVDGVMAVFDWQKRTLVERRRHEKGLTITAVAWNPANQHHLAFCDKEGQLGLVEDLLTSSQETGDSSTGAMTTTGMEGVFDDDDDMLIQASCKVVDDDDDDDDDDSASIDLGAIKKSMMPLITGEEESRDSLWGDKAGEESGAAVKASTPVAPIVVEGFKPTPMQKPFQPGCTPEHLSSRFMKWNGVGIVRQYNTEEESSIDVEFHDTATHHAMHVSNSSDFTMADLSTQAVVLATASDEDARSKLLCMHFGSWDSAKEWSVTVPDGEVIQAVAAGEGWVAVATSRRAVRVMTVGGVQLTTFTLPGPVVCLAGHRQRLMAVYHAGMGIPGDQNMACTTLNVKGQKRTAEQTPLPLSPQSTLSWAGFSAEGTPFTMDSEGVVRMLNTGLAHTWTQVADTRQQLKGKSDHYWIVGVNENPQQLRCIPCKGSRYPATLPRPAVAVLPFRLSLCEPDSEKSQYEEQYLRSVLLAQHLHRLSGEGMPVDEDTVTALQRPAQEALMKLFALSARSDREFRAMEVCDMMPDEQTLQLSIKYATRQRHLRLAQRISQLAQQRAQQEEEEQEEEEDYREYLEASHNNSETEWATKSSLGSRREEEGEEEDMEEEEEDRKPSGPMLNIKPKEKLVKKPSFGRANPFKVSSQETGQGVKGSQVFDAMKKAVKERAPVISPLPISVKQSKGGQRKIVVKGKQSQQAKLAFSNPGSETSPAAKTPTTPVTAEVEQSENLPTKKGASAFDLWLEAHRGDLEEEHPDLSEEDLSRAAAEQFRALPREDRQVWLQRAKSQKQAEEGESDKKRKRTEEKEDDNKDDVPAKAQKTKAPTSPTKKPLSQSTNSKLASFAFSSKPE